jgi:DNA-3-methyladenine glycosylase II
MSLSAEQIRHSLDALAAIEPCFARALESIGYPEPRIRDRGYQTLLRTIVGQQVSVAAASSIWTKLETIVRSKVW